MKIELTIKTTYLPNWGSFEGIRELVQNGKDAETEFDAQLEVRHRADTNALVIENSGCTLPHEALLFGHTTKEGRGDLIGKFGEGLKLGVLALVRAGHEIKIRSGEEVWLPKIERSEKFDADVLVFYIEKGRQPKNRVQIEISNISKEEWDLVRPCFLFLNRVKKEDRLVTMYGSLLLGESDIGKIFVKGIFVQKDPNLKFGYDLTRDVEVDRDRKMVSRFDLEYHVQLIWRESVVQRKDLGEKFLDLVQDATGDVAGLNVYNAPSLPKEVVDQAVARFKSQYGEHAVPVDTISDSKDMEHLGKTGVLVNKPLKALLQSVFGDTDQIKAGLAKEIVKLYSWYELSGMERFNLEEAIALVNQADPVSLDQVDVVDFRSSTFQGMFKDGRVLVAKNKLLDRDVTLEIVVHEVAHRNGGDGEHKHVAAIERIWGKITAVFRDKLIVC